MLAIKKETDYALQFLKILATAKGKVVSLKDISQEAKVSFLFLQKIARKLKLAKLVLAIQGVEGGYKLNGSPKNISLMQVVEATEGKCAILSCLCEPTKRMECKKATKCGIKKRLTKTNRKILALLNDIKLSEI